MNCVQSPISLTSTLTSGISVTSSEFVCTASAVPSRHSPLTTRHFCVSPLFVVLPYISSLSPLSAVLTHLHRGGRGNIFLSRLSPVTSFLRIYRSLAPSAVEGYASTGGWGRRFLSKFSPVTNHESQVTSFLRIYRPLAPSAVEGYAFRPGWQASGQWPQSHFFSSIDSQQSHFQVLTNPSLRNPFVFTSICVAGGCGVALPVFSLFLSSVQPQASCFQRLAHSLSPETARLPFFSAAYRLFLQIQGGGRAICNTSTR